LLRSFTLALPAGLSFARSARLLAYGITLTAGGQAIRYSAAVRGGRITLTFIRGYASVSFGIRRPGLVESRSLPAKIRRHRVRRLTFTVIAVDTAGRQTRLSLTFKA
jgi:hypothetical protein